MDLHCQPATCSAETGLHQYCALCASHVMYAKTKALIPSVYRSSHLRRNAKLVVESVMPNLLHIIPVRDDAMLDWILQS